MSAFATLAPVYNTPASAHGGTLLNDTTAELRAAALNQFLASVELKAFKIAQALLVESGRERLLPSFLKMVAIATIADAVPLIGENRVFAKLGLEGLRKPVNAGLRALLSNCDLDGSRPLSAGDIAFRVAPRLNAAGRGGHSGRSRVGSAFVACEVALALVTLVGAGLFLRGFRQTMNINPGFNPDHVLLNQFYLSTNGYTLAQRREFCRRLEERLLSAPGVTDVAFSDGVPLGFEPSSWEELDIEGYARHAN